MSDAPIPGIVRLHLGVLATRSVRPFVISDTVTIFRNNVLVAFKSDGGRAPENTMLVTDTLVPDYHALKVISRSETVSKPTLTPLVADTVATPVENIYKLLYNETVAPVPIAREVTDVPFLTVSALNTIILIVPVETLTWTAVPPSITDTAVVVIQNLYRPTFSDTINRNPAISLTDTVNTILT